MSWQELARSAASAWGPEFAVAVAGRMASASITNTGSADPIDDAAALFVEAVEIARQSSAKPSIETLYSLLAEKCTEGAKLLPEQKASILGMAAYTLVAAPDAGKPRSGIDVDDDGAASTSTFMLRAMADELRGDDAVNGVNRGSFGRPLYFTPFADMDYYCVIRPFHWKPNPLRDHGAVTVDVPKGFVTDLASVPRPFWSILAPTGRHGQAAIFHDWLYWQQTYPRDIADRTFEAIMGDLNVSFIVRKSVTGAVKTFGERYWNDNHQLKIGGEKRILSLLPTDPRITWSQWKLMPGVFS